MDEAIALYESGWTTKQIAEKYHMTDNAVSRRLKKAGTKMRARWDISLSLNIKAPALLLVSAIK